MNVIWAPCVCVCRQAGVPYSNDFHIVVRQNGQYFGLVTFVEDTDDTYLMVSCTPCSKVFALQSVYISVSTHSRHCRLSLCSKSVSAKSVHCSLS